LEDRLQVNAAFCGHRAPATLASEARSASRLITTPWLPVRCSGWDSAVVWRATRILSLPKQPTLTTYAERYLRVSIPTNPLDPRLVMLPFWPDRMIGGGWRRRRRCDAVCHGLQSRRALCGLGCVALKRPACLLNRCDDVRSHRPAVTPSVGGDDVALPPPRHA
jgi:hypothetical protein